MQQRVEEEVLVRERKAIEQPRQGAYVETFTGWQDAHGN
jgi:hypothetical protein